MIVDVEELLSMIFVEVRFFIKLLNGVFRSEEFYLDIGVDLYLFGDLMKEEVFVGCEDEYIGSFRGE